MTARTPRGEKPSMGARSISTAYNSKKSPHAPSLNPLDRLVSEDSEVEIVASCYDEEHPPEHALEQNTTSFFMTTGMFPQELFLGFKEEVRIAELKIVSSEVHTISIDRVIPNQSEVTQNLLWKQILRVDLQRNEIQKETHKMNNLAVKYLKITIESGYDKFASIFSINIRSPEGKWLLN